MLLGSRTHTHQSVPVSFGAPTPISLWKALIAVPQGKRFGKRRTLAASAGTAASIADRMRTPVRGMPLPGSRSLRPELGGVVRERRRRVLCLPALYGRAVLDEELHGGFGGTRLLPFA